MYFLWGFRSSSPIDVRILGPDLTSRPWVQNFRHFGPDFPPERLPSQCISYGARLKIPHRRPDFRSGFFFRTLGRVGRWGGGGGPSRPVREMDVRRAKMFSRGVERVGEVDGGEGTGGAPRPHRGAPPHPTPPAHRLQVDATERDAAVDRSVTRWCTPRPGRRSRPGRGSGEPFGFRAQIISKSEKIFSRRGANKLLIAIKNFRRRDNFRKNICRRKNLRWGGGAEGSEAIVEPGWGWGRKPLDGDEPRRFEPSSVPAPHGHPTPPRPAGEKRVRRPRMGGGAERRPGDGWGKGLAMGMPMVTMATAIPSPHSIRAPHPTHTSAPASPYPPIISNGRVGERSEWLGDDVIAMGWVGRRHCDG